MNAYTNPSKSKPTKRSSWFRKLALGAGIFILLMAGVYFIVTSSAFLKASVLPRVGKAIGADLNAEAVTLSPFSQVVLKKMRLQTIGAEPLVTADEATVKSKLQRRVGNARCGAAPIQAHGAIQRHLDERPLVFRS